MTFGLYPDVSLVAARQKRAAAHKELHVGINPGADVELPPPSVTFETVARAWHALNMPRWKPSQSSRASRDDKINDLFAQLKLIW